MKADNDSVHTVLSKDVIDFNAITSNAIQEDNSTIPLMSCHVDDNIHSATHSAGWDVSCNEDHDLFESEEEMILRNVDRIILHQSPEQKLISSDHIEVVMESTVSSLVDDNIQSVNHDIPFDVPVNVDDNLVTSEEDMILRDVYKITMHHAQKHSPKPPLVMDVHRVPVGLSSAENGNDIYELDINDNIVNARQEENVVGIFPVMSRAVMEDIKFAKFFDTGYSTTMMVMIFLYLKRKLFGKS